MDKIYLLVVDDDIMIRTQIKDIFEGQYTVLEASDGKEALDILLDSEYAGKISVVILDLYMPEVSGFDVLSVLRAECGQNHVPVIITSTSTSVEDEARAFELGAIDYISKPIEPVIADIRVRNGMMSAENSRLVKENLLLEKKQAEDERYRLVLEHTNTTVIEYLCETGEFLCDPLTGQLLSGNYDKRSFLDVLREDRIAAPDDISLIKDIIDSMTDSYVATEQELHIKMVAKNGESHWTELHFMPLIAEGESTKKVIITLNDVNEAILSRREIHFMREYDSMTGIYNYQSFVDRVSELLVHRSDTNYIIIRFDIDKFKMINEAFGHEEGNRLLKYIGAMIQNRVSGNGICARLEADTFAVCIPNTSDSASEFVDFCRKSVAAFSLPMAIKMNFGVYEITDTSVPLDVMMNHASFAHKSSKQDYNTNVIFYDEGQKQQLLEEHEFLDETKSALEKGEFRVYIQPKVDMETGAIKGGEALVRWIHPQKGIISPARFIPVLERHNLILSLDYYIWEETCKYLRKWMDQGIEVCPVSVNISRNNLFNHELPDLIVNLCDKYGIPHNLLELEITETTYVSDANMLIEITERLQRSGFTVLMDDFGSGYSSLNMLKDLPVDILKIDLRFLYDVDKSTRAAIILSSIIKMARTLSLPTIAEGVETVEQADLLKNAGCKIAQGFLYFRPMPAEEFEEKLILQQQS